jgi:RNA polymerase sigma factor (sigma-70 family)
MPQNIDNDHFRALLRSSPADAIDILYSRVFKGLVRYSEYLTQNREASLDIVQEAFIHVWQNHEELSEPHKQSIQAYLVKYVKMKSMTEFTQRVRHNELLRLVAEAPRNGHSVETEIIRNEIRAELRAVISTFPARERECLFMKLDRELSPGQIAIELNVSLKTVEKHLTNGNKRLRAHFRSKN